MKRTLWMKEKEANARRKVAERWSHVGSTPRYIRAAVREASYHSVRAIRDEAFDGILLTLTSRNSGKSMNVQKRVLRRIVEKRQAQIAHRYMGHTEDLTASYTTSRCSSRCMRKLGSMSGMVISA